MREIIIRLDGRMIGALWVRGYIEIDGNGVHASYFTNCTQFCPTPANGEHVTYEVKP